MPAAWEKKEVELVIGLPHQGTVTMEWVLGLLQLEQKQAAYYSFQRGMPIDVARNKVCEKVIELQAKGVFFLDTDVVAPKDTLLRLMGHRLPIVSGIYYRKQAHEGIYSPAVWVRAPPEAEGGKYSSIAEFPKGRMIEADVIGMGCCWISRRVLEEWIKCPSCARLMTWRDEGAERLYYCEDCKTDPRKTWWFFWSKERTDLPNEGISEDFHFCEEAKKLGYKILVDTSVSCRHIGQFAVEDGHVREAAV